MTKTKTKVSVTLDPDKLATARELLATATVSELLDVALERLITQERDRRHVEGYLRRPQDGDEIGWANIERDQSDIADDTDWAALYGVTSEP